MLQVILWVLVAVSSTGVIYQNYHSRNLFAKIQQLELELEKCEIESGMLQLERTTLAGYGRIENAARAKIGLIQPGREAIVYLNAASSKDTNHNE